MKPKNGFGVEVIKFAAKTGMSIREICEATGQKYITVVSAMDGRRPGREAVAAVRKYMAEYLREKAS